MGAVTFRIVPSGTKLNPILRLIDPRQYVYVIPNGDRCHGVAPAVIVREKR